MIKKSCLTIACVILSVAGARAAEPVEIDGLKSTPPAGWTKGKPASQMQYAVFTLPKAEGVKDDTTLTIYFFGPGSGGGVDANIKRWKGMFKPNSGESSTDHFKVGGVNVTEFDAAGTYLFKARPMDATAVEKPDYRMVGVIFESKNGPYYMRLVGPKKSVDKDKKDFDEWLKSFK